MYENTPIVPITPYHVPYVPSFHHTVPSTQHHPTVSTQLPNVNEALSKVENDLQSLNDTLSHPHTINDPISFIRASQISSQVQQLNKKMSVVKKQPQVPPSSMFSPRSRTVIQRTKNVSFSPNLVSPPSIRPNYTKPTNPYDRSSPKFTKPKPTNPYDRSKKNLRK